MLQKRVPVHGSTVSLDLLRIRIEVREAEGQLVQPESEMSLTCSFRYIPNV